jgi:phage recombination protein Bet
MGDIIKADNQLQKYGIGETEIQELTRAGIIPADCPPAQVAIFARVCAERNLSPFSKQIHLVGRWNSKLNKNTYTHQVGIDGFRAIASRTGVFAGSDDCLYDEGLNLYQMIDKGRKQPKTATMTVYKIVHGTRCPFTASISWDDYYPGEKQGFMWREKPFIMASKTAESVALRKAFPEDLSGLYTDEEMHQADIVINPVKVEMVIKETSEAAKVAIETIQSSLSIESEFNEFFADIPNMNLVNGDKREVWNALIEQSKKYDIYWDADQKQFFSTVPTEVRDETNNDLFITEFPKSKSKKKTYGEDVI